MHIGTIPQAATAQIDQTNGQNNTQQSSGIRSLALSASEDDPSLRQKYRPFIIPENPAEPDWVNALELDTVLDIAENNLRLTNERLRVLVLYGSLRRRSYSKLVAFEAARILFRLGCDVRVFDPTGLPVKNDVDQNHPKVQELRGLSTWSDGHLWVSPEQHGNLVRPYPLPQISLSDNSSTNAPKDSRLQKPNRLDPPKHRQRPPNPRPHPIHRASLRRVPILQRSKLPPHSRPVDADVHDPESIVHPEGVHAVSG